MAIQVKTQDLQTRARPVEFTLVDRSAAHVTLTLVIEGRMPITHSFVFNEGDLKISMALAPGAHRCSFVVQAFKHGALGPMYDSGLIVDGQRAAHAAGHIPDGRTNDVGFGDFVLTVI